MPNSCLTRRKPGRVTTRKLRESLEFTQSKIEEIVTIKSAFQEKKIEMTKNDISLKKIRSKEKSGATGKCLRMLSFSRIMKITILNFERGL